MSRIDHWKRSQRWRWDDRVVWWWCYSRAPALDFIWMSPDNDLWSLDDAPWVLILATVCAALVILAAA